MESWVQDEGGNMTDLTGYVRDKLQVLCLFPESRDLAIKIFQTVNDRGKNLSLLDKTKSFLMFYITRYLEDKAGSIADRREKTVWSGVRPLRRRQISCGEIQRRLPDEPQISVQRG